MSDKVEMVKLNYFQVSWIYFKSIRHDFPKNERKPLLVMLKGMKTGVYECLGMKENGKISGYAFFVKDNKNYLFDYLAVFENSRNSGLGGSFLELLIDYYKDADSIIGEVEDPNFAATEEDRAIQTRRYHFYMRHGIIDTKIKVETFGAHYIILRVDLGDLSEDEIKELYITHYRNILPPDLFKNSIKF